MRLALVVSIILFSTAAQEQVQAPTQLPEIIAGPWESTNASGIDGIFFNIDSSLGLDSRQQIAWQTINIRVYHREAGRETGGWSGTKEKATPESYNTQDNRSFTLFDGERLRIHSVDVTELQPFDLDVTFSPTAQVWTGKLSRGGRSVHIVLERPKTNAGAAQSAFVGDWESTPNSNPRLRTAPGSLHICESSDGVLGAWLDLTIGNIDEHDGEQLRVISATDAGLILQPIPGLGPSPQYRGSLSEDRQGLTGTWEIVAGGRGGRINAPDSFTRTSNLRGAH
jgi:hypothetical protein